MSRQPLISVVVPAWNSVRYLDRCLESVLRQTHGRLELIVVDDGSTDGTAELLLNHARRDSRVVMCVQAHSGGGAARNRGLDLAHGEYCYFLDSDDFIEPTLLAECLAALQITGCDMCIFDILLHDAASNEETNPSWCVRRKFLPRHNPFRPAELAACLFTAFANWPWNKFFRMRLVKGNGIRFQEIMRTNDLLFTCSAMTLSSRLCFLDRRLVHHRTNAGGNCQATNHLHPFDFIRAFNALKAFLLVRGAWETYRCGFLNHKLSGAIYNLFSLRDRAAFAKVRAVLRHWLVDCLAGLDRKNVHSKSDYQACLDLFRLDTASFMRAWGGRLALAS